MPGLIYEKVVTVGNVRHAHSCPLPLADSQSKVVFPLRDVSQCFTGEGVLLETIER